MAVSTKRLKQRLKDAKREPRTWAGFGLIVYALTGVPADLVTAVTQALLNKDYADAAISAAPYLISLAAGAASVALPEKKAADDVRQ